MTPTPISAELKQRIVHFAERRVPMGVAVMWLDTTPDKCGFPKTPWDPKPVMRMWNYGGEDDLGTDIYFDFSVHVTIWTAAPGLVAIVPRAS